MRRSTKAYELFVQELTSRCIEVNHIPSADRKGPHPELAAFTLAVVALP